MQTQSTLPVRAEFTYATCKAYSQQLSAQIREWLIPTMIKNGIDPRTSLFADLQIQPELWNDPNPYKVLMNVLKQFAGVVSGGYDATVRFECARQEIDRLNKLIDQLTQ